MNNWRDDLLHDMLLHDGQKGMKWGRRRYRNYDGTLTPAGRERYGVGPAVQNVTRKLSRKERKAQKEIARKVSAKAAEKAAKKAIEESKRAAEEAGRAKEELRKERESAAAEKEDRATAEGNAQLKLEADRAKLNADILREINNRIKQEQEYNSLVHPKDNTQRESFIKRAVVNVQNIKGIISNVNDVAKMVSDIKKAFKGDKESEYDLLKKDADIDKLKYDMETRNQKRAQWKREEDARQESYRKAKQEAEASASEQRRQVNQDFADRWASEQAARSAYSYGSNNRSGSAFTKSWRAERAVNEYRQLPVSSILALPPGSYDGQRRKKKG